MNEELTGTISIVAGCAQPLEIEIIQSLLRANATVIVPASNAETIYSIKCEMTGICTGSLITLLTDPMDYEKAEDITRHIHQNYGKIDLMVVLSNKEYSHLPLTELEYTTWDQMQHESLSLYFMNARLVLPLMKHSGQGTYIHISNAPEEDPHRYSPLETIAHNAQVEMSKIFAEEVKTSGVRYYHVFSNNTQTLPDHHGAANYIINLFREKKKPAKNIFHYTI